MTPTDSGLKLALQEIIHPSGPSEKKYLAARPQGQGYAFTAIPLKGFALFWRQMGFGDAAPKNAAKALTSKKDELRAIADGLWEKEDKDKLVLFDHAVSQIYAEAGMPEQAIDLFEGRYAAWMQQLPARMKERKINRLCLPSTHDSGAYKIDWDLPVVNDTLAKIARILPFVRTIITSWTVTQYGDIGSQLRKGIRCLDLRISYNEESGKFFLTHTFTCDHLDVSLKAIKGFLADNPHEVLVIGIKPDWGHRESCYPQAGKLEKLLTGELGELLYCPSTDLKLPTYNEMTESRKRILAVSTDENFALSSPIWSYQTYQTHWCDTSNLETKMDYLQGLLKKVPDSPYSFYDFSITLTPQVSDIVVSVIERIFLPWTEPRSLHSLTDAIQRAAQSFFVDEREQLRQTSLAVTDFPYHSYVHQVVSLNYKAEEDKTALPKAAQPA